MNSQHARALALALTILLAPSGFAATAATLSVDDLRCEYLVNPLGIDARAPRLSWKLVAVRPESRGLSQSGYQVLVAPSEALLREDKGAFWDSGKVASSQSLHVAYAGKPLASHDVCWWKVRVWDQDGNVSAWSAPARWTMGLLDARDWTARWIGLDSGEETDEQVTLLKDAAWIWYPGGKSTVGAPIGTRYFRRSINLPEGRRVRKAFLLATADDSFVAYVNGRSVGAGQSWAEVKRLDVTGQLRPGLNTLAVAATNAPSSNVAPEKNPAGLIGILKVEFEEGEPLLAPTDTHWRTSDKAVAGWEQAGFDDAGWKEPQIAGASGAAPWGKLAGPDHRRLPARMLRREFRVARDLRRATASVCGLGFFDLHLNGRQISDQLMNPALTGYDRRVCYVTFDVTPDVHPRSQRRSASSWATADTSLPAAACPSRRGRTDTPSYSSRSAWNTPTARWRTWSLTQTGI